MRWRFSTVCRQLEDSIYSGRPIANETVRLAVRLTNDMPAACPVEQRVSLTLVVFVKYQKIMDLLQF
jgi:hypothetical protein